MPSNNSQQRREERRDRADWRALQIQLTCLACGLRHALRRCCHASGQE